nr:leucine-rich repeat-containing protein 70-like [Leptinotarsa decemlineata]
MHWVHSEGIYQNSSHICDTCKCSDGNSFIMDCSDQNFQHVLANWPINNKSLIAKFSNNNLTTLQLLPTSNQRAKLVFDHCKIKYIEGGVFSNMKNVEFIDLSYNFLTTEEIDGNNFKGPYNNSKFHPLPSLKYLNLAYNQIHSLPRKFFENMPNLEELNLEGNDFTVLDPQTQLSIGTLTRLTVLNLANNELTEVEGEALRNLSNLKKIDLSSNQLDFVPESLEYLGKTLQVLNLSENYIFQLNDKSFMGLNIRELHLNNLPRLEFIGPNTFATLHNLKKLHLFNNLNLKDIDVEAFGKNQTLDELYLNNNSLKTIPFKLIYWSQLKILNIDGNPLECDCNLYNITKAVSTSVIKNMNYPICYDDEDKSIDIYLLNENNCKVKGHRFHIAQVSRHFDTMRTILIILSTLLIIGTILTIVIGHLRYKKGLSLRSYPFVAQVSYNPITTEYI